MNHHVPAIAQTNLQLYVQMHDAGLPSEYIQVIQRDYETACKLFGNVIRSTGKPFLCHAVGTASMALINGANSQEIRAGLLHAAYSHGRFPNGKSGLNSVNRNWLKEQTDDDVEALIFEYHRFSFDQESVEHYLGFSDRYSELQRSILIIRISNEVDDSMNYASVLGGKARYKNSNWLNSVISLCDVLDLPDAKAAMKQVEREMKDNDWLDTEMRFERPRTKRKSFHEIWSGLVKRWRRVD